MDRVTRILKKHREAGALHELVPMFAFVSPHAFLTKSGDIGVVLATKGIDYECLDPAELDAAARRFEAALKVLDERLTVYQYLLKRASPAIPCLTYPDNPTLDRAVRNRIEYLSSKGDELFDLASHVVILFRGSRKRSGIAGLLSDIASDPAGSFRRLFSAEKRTLALEHDLEESLATLTNRVQAFLVQAGDLLGARLCEKHEAFAFFRRLLNYSHPDSARLKYDTFVDYFAAGETIECHRDHLRVEDSFTKVLVLRDPPAQTAANLLRALVEIQSSYIAVSEWKREPNDAIRRRIRSARRHHHNSKYSLMSYVASAGDSQAPSTQDLLKDDSREAMVNELGQCLKEIEVNGNFFGRFSLSVVLHDPDLAKLERSVAECFKAFSTRDAGLQEERYNLLNAWLAVLPGNAAYNLRYIHLLSTNYADMSFIFTLDEGDPVNSHLDSEYLAVLETSQKTPYFLNLHCDDVAHTLILGATGSGKSFLLNFLVTHLQKYRPLTCIFDLGGSYERLTQTFGGSYLRIGIERRPFTINPFSLPPTQENLNFLHSFVKVLLRAAGCALSDQDERDLYDQIESLYEIERENRRLRTLANILNRRLRDHLTRWVEGGQYGALFDNVEDNLTLSRFQCFDFEGMDRYPQVLEPLLFYILHRANASIHDHSLDTTFKVFVMDEAWRFLRDETIRLYITEALKTWRKRNAAMIMATQSRADLDTEGMMATVVESCPTKIFLSNPGIDREAYSSIFHLNRTESRLISELVPRREILVKRPTGSKVLSLDVDAESYALCANAPGSGTHHTQIPAIDTEKEASL